MLHYSEATAYHRIQAARAARAYPPVLEHLRRGELHLSGVRLLAPHLTPENHVELLERARHQSKRAIEAWLTDRAPKPDAASLVRRLPQRNPTAAAPLAATNSGSPAPATEPSSASPLAARDKGSSPTASKAARAADSGTPAPLRAAPVPASPATRPPSPAPQPLGQVHNHYAALQDYGAAHMERCRRSGRKNAQPRTRTGISSPGTG